MGFIPPHGGYRNLLSFQKAEIVFDITVRFCERFLEKRDRTVDQMIQAARSGKQNIVEGSRASAASTESELKLTNVARASFEELLVDYEDYLRVRRLRKWEKDSKEALYVRNQRDLAKFRDLIETRTAEAVANIAICLIHQTNYLLDQQLRRLEADFVEKGSIRERMKEARVLHRSHQSHRSH